MESKRERIAEYIITDWEEAKIRVTAFIPQLQNTLTSQIILGREDMERLRYLEMPEEIKMLDGAERQFAIIPWQEKNELARKVRDSIANKIADHLSYAISQEINIRNN